jgi:hypothetical protein
MLAELRERIVADIRAVAADPDIAMGLAATGQVVNFGTASEFAASIEGQRSRVAEAAEHLGLKPAQ